MKPRKPRPPAAGALTWVYDAKKAEHVAKVDPYLLKITEDNYGRTCCYSLELDDPRYGYTLLAGSSHTLAQAKAAFSMQDIGGWLESAAKAMRERLA